MSGENGDQDRFSATIYKLNERGEVADYFAYLDRGRHMIRANPNREYLNGLGCGVVLEIGAGVAGDYLHLCGEATQLLVCSDCSPSALDIITRNLSRTPELKKRVVPVCADAYQLGFPDGAFDTVIAIFVIEHLRFPERLVAEAARVLRKGGRLILTTDTRTVHTLAYVAKFTWLFLKFWRIPAVYRYIASRHVSLFTPRELYCLLDPLFTVERQDLWYPLPGYMRGQPCRLPWFPERLSLGMFVVARRR